MHVHYLVKHLLKQGCEIRIVTGTALESHQEQPECPITRFNLGTQRRNLWKMLIQLPRFIALVARHDVIHAHYSYMFAFFSVLLGRLLGKQTVVTLHGLGTLDSSIKGSRLRTLYRYVSLRFAHKIIATSPEMRDVALRFAPDERIEIIENGVDIERFKVPPHRSFDHVREKMRLGSLRRMVPKNGVHFLIDALTQADPRLSASVLLIGDGPVREHIENSVASNKLAEVTLIGPQGHDQVIEMLGKMDVVAFLSTAESFSLAALECMATGCVVVSSNAGAYPELIRDGDNGFMVDLFEPGKSDYRAPMELSESQYQQIIGTLRRIQSMPPEDLASISSRARETVVDRFSWHMIAEKTVQRCYQA